VLEQDGHAIAYGPVEVRTELQHHSVRMLSHCGSLEKFRHYFLGRKFTLCTDHAPVQWLSVQRMEGLLARWALAIQEYNFTIVYPKGTENVNADALSAHCLFTHFTQGNFLKYSK